MSAKLIFIIFFGILAVALGFTLPELQYGNSALESVNGHISENVELVRSVRSPQRSFEARGAQSRRGGASAGVNYNHPINKNLDAYAGASRNFKQNDNSAHAGLKLKF